MVMIGGVTGTDGRVLAASSEWLAEHIWIVAFGGCLSFWAMVWMLVIHV